MARAVSEVMDQTDDAASAVADTRAIVHDYLRVTKQVDRFTQLLLALRKQSGDRRIAEAANHPPSLPVPGPNAENRS
jgi:hypothetical protein